MSESESKQKSITLFPTSLSTLLTVAFVVLKLTHYIDWSWWWVLSPVWIPICSWVIITMIVILVQVYGSPSNGKYF